MDEEVVQLVASQGQLAAEKRILVVFQVNSLAKSAAVATASAESRTC